MDSIEILKNKRAHFLMSAQELTEASEKEARAMSKEEVAEYDKYLADVAKIDADIESIEADAKRKADLKAKMEKVDTRKVPASDPSRNSPNAPVFAEPKDFSNPFSGVNRRGKANSFKSDKDKYLSGSWMINKFGKGAAQSRAGRVLRENGMEARATFGEGSGAIGGDLIPTILEKAIIVEVELAGTVRKLMDVMPMGESPLVNVPKRLTGASANWIAENGTVTESEATFSQVQIITKKLGALSTMSREINDDAVINLAEFIAKDFAYQFAIAEDNAWLGGTNVSGSGINSIPVTLLGSYAGQYIAGGSVSSGHKDPTTLTIADATALMALCPAYALSKARWIMSPATYQSFLNRLSATAGGNNTLTLAMGLAGSNPSAPWGTFLGYPVEVCTVMDGGLLSGAQGPGIGVTGTIGVLFGDLNLTGVFGQRSGISVSVSNDRYFELDQIAIKAVERVGFAVHNLGSSTVPGSMVGLIYSNS